MKRWRYVLLVLCTAVISISGTYLMNYFMKSEENKQKYEDISEIGFPETEADHEEENDQQDVKQSEDDFDYQSLIAMNSDCVGWIQIPGTDINYPVVQAADNEFYLTHNFNRETAACGAIFMDYRNDVDAKAEHLILYGHQMKDNSMFKQGDPGSFLNVLCTAVLGVDSARVTAATENAQNILDAVDHRRTSISGVDEDEEGQNLVIYQNLLHYQYRVLSIMNEALDKLINGTAV